MYTRIMLIGYINRVIPTIFADKYFLMRVDIISAPSGPPTEVEVEVTSSTSITLSWQPPHLLHRNGIINSYQVYLLLPLEGIKVEYEFGPEDCWLFCVIDGQCYLVA